jgi:hypothetical protein
MSESSIGRLSVVLSADSRLMESSIDRAGAKVKSFGSIVDKALGGVGLSAITNPAGAAGNVLNSILGGVTAGGGPAGLVAGGVLLAKDAFDEFKGSLMGTADKFNALNKEAATFGITLDGLVGLKVAAKDKADELTIGLTHLQREIGGAVGGSKDAQVAFLALGLDAQQLANVPLDDAFARIADQIKVLPTQAERARAAFELFGKQGQQLNRLLSGGSAGINEATARAINKGLVPDPTFAATIAEYKNTAREFDETLEGLSNKLKGYFGAPLLKVGTTVMDAMSNAIDEMFGGTVSAADVATERAVRAFEAQRKAAEEMQAAQRKAAAEALVDLRAQNDQLEKQIKYFGLSAEEARVAELQHKAEGVAIAGTSDAIAKNIALTRELADLNLRKALIGETQTAYEKATAKLTEMNTAFGSGAIKADLFGRGILKVLADLEAMGKVQDQAFPAALLQGSQAARTFTLEADRQRERANADPVDRLREALAVGKAEDERQTQLLRQILSAIKDGKLQVAGF